MVVLKETKRVARLSGAKVEMCVSGVAGGSDRAGAMAAPGIIRIALQHCAAVACDRGADSGPALQPRVLPLGAAVSPNGFPPHRRGWGRDHAWAWGGLSLLVHGAAALVLLSVVPPRAVEAPASDPGISMVFVDAAPVAPTVDAAAISPTVAVAPEEPPVAAEKSPEPAPSLPDPPTHAASVQPDLAPAASAAREEERTALLPIPPVPPAPVRSTHGAVARVPPAEDVSPRTSASAGAPAATSAPHVAAPIIAPRPVAGMADNRPPRYPESARRRQEQGQVMVGVSVAADGTPIDTRIDLSSGHKALDEAAMEAVRGWRFVPGSQDNRPVVASAEVPIVFRLQD
jgi:protein TonB